MPKEKYSSDDRVADSNTNTRKKKKTKFVKLELGDSDWALAPRAAASLSASVPEKTWWEAWQENCSIRSLFYDQDMTTFQRLTEATQAFNKNRVWPISQTQVRNRWDQFQVYAGLLENAAGDELPRLTRLAHNPGLVIQIYLSSYFIEKGLHFSKHNCDIIPKLLFFYINFLLVNRVLPDKEDDLHRALLVIEKAKTELGLFSRIGQSCPDHFNLTCKELLGDTTGTAMVLAQESIAPEETENVDSVEDPMALETSNRKKKRNRKSKAKKSPVKPAQDNTTSDSLVPRAIECEEIVDTGGWGSVGSWGADASSGGWGSGSAGGKAWAADTSIAASVEDDGWGNFKISPPASSFVPAHIAKALPTTHFRGVVEHSVRRVKAIIPPMDQTVSRVKREDDHVFDAMELERELTQDHWMAVLEPWPMKLTTADAPQILSCSNGNVTTTESDQIVVEEGAVNDLDVGNVIPHKCLVDEITIFLEEEASKCLQIGMGLGGTWAQLLRASDRIEGAIKGEGNGETRYWYVLEVLRIQPSYFTVWEDHDA